MEIKIKVLPPTISDCIRVQGKAGTKQGGIANSNTIHVGDLTKEQAEEYCEFLKNEFMKHWEKQTILRP